MAAGDRPLLEPSTPPATKFENKRVCARILLLTAADSASMPAAFLMLGSRFRNLHDAPWCMILCQIGVIVGQSVVNLLLHLTCHTPITPSLSFSAAARLVTGLGTADMPLMLNIILKDRSAWHGINPLGQLLGVGGGYIVDYYGWQVYVWAVLSFGIVWGRLPLSRLGDSWRTQCNIRAAFVLALTSPLTFWWLGRRATATDSLIPWESLRDKPMLYVVDIATITAFTDMSVTSDMGAVMTIGWLGIVAVGEILGYLACSSMQRDRHIFVSSQALSCLSFGIRLINKDWVKLVGLVLAGFSSELANGTSITMIMRYTERKGVRVRQNPDSRQGDQLTYLSNILLAKNFLESFDYIGTLPDWPSRRVLASFLEAIQTCFGYILAISAIGAIVSFRHCSRFSPRDRV
ncbi:hypothetical protein BDV06DRAFT_216365 [Aspergillus oleicola]